VRIVRTLVRCRSDLSFAASAAATPLLRLLDGESAHRLAVWAAANGLVPRERRPDPPSLQARFDMTRCACPVHNTRRTQHAHAHTQAHARTRAARR
jgi:hypothetical protein